VLQIREYAEANTAPAERPASFALSAVPRSAPFKGGEDVA
jgi:hypothetical protein